MGIELVEHEIRRFLSEKQAGVLAMSGKWGVGKTFAWKRFLGEAQSNGELAFERYSYVSLFGLGKLDDLRTAIFQNTVKNEDIGQFAGIETLQSVVQSAPALWRKGGVLARLIPGVETYGAAFEKIGFFWVKRQLICFDDLERKSASLEMREVLGLISHLIELASRRGWGGNDERILSTLTADDFYAIFKRLRGDELRQAVAGALFFREVVNANEAMKSTTSNAISALQRIGTESDINRRRVVQRGVKMPDAPSP